MSTKKNPATRKTARKPAAQWAAKAAPPLQRKCGCMSVPLLAGGSHRFRQYRMAQSDLEHSFNGLAPGRGRRVAKQAYKVSVGCPHPYSRPPVQGR